MILVVEVVLVVVALVHNMLLAVSTRVSIDKTCTVMQVDFEACSFSQRTNSSRVLSFVLPSSALAASCGLCKLFLYCFLPRYPIWFSWALGKAIVPGSNLTNSDGAKRRTCTRASL